MLITDVGFECHLCYETWKNPKKRKMPNCKTAIGCRVKKLATDQVLNSKVNAFRKYKILQQVKAPEQLQIEQLKLSDLLFDSNLLIEAENVYSEYRIIELEKSQRNVRKRN